MIVETQKELELATSTLRQLDDGSWRIARPENGPLLWEVKARLKAAWLIIRGRAFACRWY